MRTAMAWIVVLGACASDVDLTGVYRVDVFVGSQTCGADAPITTGAPYLKLYKDSFFGNEYFAIDGCTDPAGATCTSTGSLFGGLSEPIAMGWRGLVTSSSSAGSASTSCTLAYSETIATLAGSQLVIELHEYGQTVELPNAQCVAKEAAARGTAMPCTNHEHTEGTRL